MLTIVPSKSETTIDLRLGRAVSTVCVEAAISAVSFIREFNCGATLPGFGLSSTEATATRFNAAAEVYDETRQPLSGEALDRIASVLARDGCKTLLEAGVGTGRIAIPLAQRGFDITGIDVSPGMLTKARKKGVEGLIAADGSLPPFRGKAFDAVIMAHVLHLLEGPARTFEALEAVASKEIVVLSRARDSAHRDPDDSREIVWEAIRKASAELGHILPTRREWERNSAREVEFLSKFPPDELITLQDLSGTTTLAERMKFMEQTARGWPDSLPEDILPKVIERARSSLDPRAKIKFRRVEQMRLWKL
jgi:ubiquinone/menaquinone biosynthesis C-methylase UbiE